MNSITNHEVVSQLDRVLASQNFIHSSVLAKFLRHIVHETVDGRGHELKEYTIGVAALKKDADFNPQIDSIVRIHAGRLRRALRDYYQTDGANDPIAIVVPKGSYVPIFEINTIGKFLTSGESTYEPVEEATMVQPRGERFLQGAKFRFERLEAGPSIYVAPFKVVTNNHTIPQTSLSEYLSSELTKFEDLVVISGEAEPPTRTDYVLRGSIHLVNQRLRIFVYLQGYDGRQYWAHTFAMTYDDLWQMEDEVVAKTVAALAGINGVISRVEMQLMTLHATNTIHRPLSYWYKQHINHFDPHKTQSARLYYEDVLTRVPDNALAAAYLSEIICRQAFFEGNNEKTVLLSKALELAREALLTDPTCQQAYHAMAMITMVLGKSDECMRAIEKGLSVNANSVDFQAGVGSILIYLGKYDRGMALLGRAMELLPDPSWGHLVSLAINAFHNKAYKEALGWLEQSKVDTFWVLLVRAASAVNAEELDLANAALAEFRRKYPGLNPGEKGVIDELFVSPEVAQGIHEALQKMSDAPLYISERKSSNRYSKKGGVSI
jgi:TolB-like protein/tetratricopeptide (TPR) repeat protein